MISQPASEADVEDRGIVALRNQRTQEQGLCSSDAWETAHARLAAFNPAAYARTRNHIDGAVSGLSAYITHGVLSLVDVLSAVNARQPLEVQHKFVYELGWRAFFRHVWQHRGDGIFESLHEGPLPDAVYVNEVPEDLRQGRTGVPVIDRAVKTLYETGTLHNHARMWLASYAVHMRKVHWRAGADWMYGHLLDGDLASNHLSWQWVAGTGSSKPYLFNAENVARFAPKPWHSAHTVVDASYEVMEERARSNGWRADEQPRTGMASTTVTSADMEPQLYERMPTGARTDPRLDTSVGVADASRAAVASQVAGRDVWLVHPWSLGPAPRDLAENTLVVGVYLNECHERRPWSEQRWRFVDSRMAALTAMRWQCSVTDLSALLSQAARVRGVWDPHLPAAACRLAQWQRPPQLFPDVPELCHSFSKWWKRAVKDLRTADELLAQHQHSFKTRRFDAFKDDAP